MVNRSIQSITLSGAGSPAIVVKSYDEANLQLQQWAEEAGVDQVSFSVLFANGAKVTGIYTLHGAEGSLKEYVTALCRFNGGLEEKPWCGSEQYEAILGSMSFKEREIYRHLYCTYCVRDMSAVCQGG